MYLYTIVLLFRRVFTIRYVNEFNVDSKAEYSALSTRSRKKYKKEETKTNTASAPLIQYMLRSVKSVRQEVRVTMEERICERDEY